MDKDTQPIDELFRKTFESMPQTPASSGWDVPSDRVWQNVQGGIAQTGVTLGTKIALVAASVLCIAVATYWFGIRQSAVEAAPPAPQTQPIMAPAPAAALPQNVENEPAVSNPVEKTTVPKPKIAPVGGSEERGNHVNSRQAEKGKKPANTEGEALPEKNK
jgi:hypothetical protein